MRKRTRIMLTVLAVIVALAAVLPTAGCADKEPELPETNVAPPALEPQKEPNDSGNLINYKVNGTIASNMVVQRNAYFNVFGTADVKGGFIYGEFMGEKRYAKVDKNGEWCIKFSSHEASRDPQTLKIYPKNGEITEFTDILVGDVWIISGQSNAELNYLFARTKKPAYDREISGDDAIRIFAQTGASVVAAHEADPEYVAEPRKDVLLETSTWRKAERNNVMSFSALGYYFGKELSKLTDVPLGLVMTAAGGAALQELMPPAVAKKFGFTEGGLVTVSGYYNALAHPFTRNRITGMVFYQGESESGGDLYLTYAEHLKATVEEYRRIWGIAFPFINVQLSSYGFTGKTNWGQVPMIRAAQFDAYKMIPNSYIVSSMDQGYVEGDAEWAHPYYKFELGLRAAKIAGCVLYGIGDAGHCFAPEPESVTFADDFSVTVRFRNAGEGMKFSSGDSFLGLCAYHDYGGKIKSTVEQVDAYTLKIIPEKEPAYIGYGLMHEALSDVANITDSEGIPLPAFKVVNENYIGY